MYLIIILTFNAEESLANLKIPWDLTNNPNVFPGIRFLSHNSLPKSGFSKTIPWSGYYWPDYLAGIAYRWQIQERGFNYKLFTKTELMHLSKEELNQLSPAEKLDIVMSNYNYPTVYEERARTRISSPNWYGLCDDLAIASMTYRAPRKKTLKNNDGLEISFYPSDIKAIMAWSFNRSKTQYYFLGKRCFEHNKLTNDPCWDTNPGTFHLILTNHIGINEKPFVLDANQYNQVWNKVIVGYRIKNQSPVEESLSNSSTIRRIKILVEVYSIPYSRPSRLNSNYKHTNTDTYEYYIEVDQNKKITGGEWISANTPDFLWMLKSHDSSNNYSYNKIFNLLFKKGPQWNKKL